MLLTESRLIRQVHLTQYLQFWQTGRGIFAKSNDAYLQSEDSRDLPEHLWTKSHQSRMSCWWPVAAESGTPSYTADRHPTAEKSRSLSHIRSLTLVKLKYCCRTVASHFAHTLARSSSKAGFAVKQCLATRIACHLKFNRQWEHFEQEVKTQSSIPICSVQHCIADVTHHVHTAAGQYLHCSLENG